MGGRWRRVSFSFQRDAKDKKWRQLVLCQGEWAAVSTPDAFPDCHWVVVTVHNSVPWIFWWSSCVFSLAFILLKLRIKTQPAMITILKCLFIFPETFMVSFTDENNYLLDHVYNSLLQTSISLYSALSPLPEIWGAHLVPFRDRL